MLVENEPSIIGEIAKWLGIAKSNDHFDHPKKLGNNYLYDVLVSS